MPMSRAGYHHTEWCDTHGWAPADAECNCLDCDGVPLRMECDRCGATPAIVQTFCGVCGPTPLCGDCTTVHVVELEMEAHRG